MLTRLATLATAVTLALLSQTAGAQLARTRDPSAAPGRTGGGIPRDAQHPYAGMWAGVRTMPVGAGEIRFQFTVTDGKYSGAMLHPGGGRAPDNNLTQTADGLAWESPNSGGGTWVYRVRLAAPDSMVGTLVLRDPPANLQPAPKGTLVLTRVAPEKSK
jgi:hypothetical protein